MSEQWVFFMELFNDMEAEIVCGLLRSVDIPCRKEDGDSLSGAMRIIGGQVDAIQILVPELLLKQARDLMRSTEGKAEHF